MAGGLGGIFDDLGGSAAQLFIWQVVGSVVGALMAPVIQSVQQEAFSLDANTPLDPSLVASMVAQAIMTASEGQGEAKRSGVDSDRFANLVTAAGSTPDIGAVIAAFQRGFVDIGVNDPTDISLHGALTSAGVRPEWFAVMEKLTIDIPSVAEVMNAWLEGQIGESEAQTRYLAAGGDPTWFQTAYNTNGQAPTPVQALELLNRGIIPESGTGPASTSYQQAFLEGPWRNKWLPSFLALREYLPPPRTVTAMYHDGQIDATTAGDLLAKQGLSASLVTAYLSPTKSTATVAEKTLAKSDILSLYGDGLITSDRAVKSLVALKYTQADATSLVALQDFKTAASALKASTSQIETLYKGGKLARSEAISELEGLKISGNTATALVNTWDVHVTQLVKELTPAQIVDAWYYGIYSPQDASSQLQQLGYSEMDAWILLTIKNKGEISGFLEPLTR